MSENSSSTAAVVLIADGLIATTQILKRLLDESYGSTQVITPEALPGTALDRRRVFVSRVCHPRYRWLPRYLKERGIDYVYYLDDNFFELTSDYDPINGSFFSHPAVHGCLEEYLRNARSVWVMSKVLGGYLKNLMPSLPLTLTKAPVDTGLFDQAYSSAQSHLKNGVIDSEIFRVGYPTSRRMNVGPLICEIANKSFERWGTRVQFEFVGWCPPEITNLPNVSLTPQIDGYEKFVKFMLNQNWDCAIAPLGDSLFENCKTNLKYREYAAARLPGIYSDCPLYRACIENNITGLLTANDANDWLARIDMLRNDVALRRRIEAAAHADARAHYAQTKVAESIRSAFFVADQHRASAQ